MRVESALQVLTFTQ